MTRRTTAAAALLALLTLLVATGCASMPSSGPVVETTAGGTTSTEQAVDINPRGPAKGASPEDIVQGFLDAMMATPPITTSIAREFLTRDASAAWQPDQTIVYGTASPARSNQSVSVDLVSASRTDSRGAWAGPLSPEESTITFPMALQNGQWRISAAPNALIVPESWFEPRFRQVSLYFFDPSGQILIPDPVFVPRGQQLASALVNGLLAGPAPELADHELTYLPGQLRAPSVPVSAAGVAQVDLTSDSAEVAVPAPSAVERLVSQLAWTLRQDPTIQNFRVSIGGRPLQVANASEFSVDDGHEYAPYVAGSSTQLFGLRDGVMVGGSPQNLVPVSGPFGTAAYALRTVVPDPRADQVAAVDATGTALYLSSVKDPTVGVTPLIGDGQDLLDPSWDFSGRVWEVDRRTDGSVVEYLYNGQMRTLDVPGVSGEDVKSFLVSRDGSRLVAVIREGAVSDRIVTSRILTNGQGKVVDALPAVEVSQPTGTTSVVRDLAWRSPTSIVVLHPVSRQLFQVRTVAVDGAPGGLDAISTTIGRDVLGLVGTPVPDEPIYAFAPGALSDLSSPRAGTVSVDPTVSSLDYVGG